MSIAMLIIGCVGCGGGSPGSGGGAHESPSHVENPVPEREMAVVRLSPEAVRRLAIENGAVTEVTASRVRLVGGEVVVPPGRTIAVSAPVGGLLRASGEPLAPGMRVNSGDTLFQLIPVAPVDRDSAARAAREVAAATAQLDAAELRVSRTQQLVAERAGPQRTLEEATAARDVARADLAAAQARAHTTRATPLLSDVSTVVRAPQDGVIRLLTAMPGQVVAAGAPLIEIVAVDALQVRVPVYSGDLPRVDPTAPARVMNISGGGEGVSASPVLGPPTSEPDRSSIDRYYELEAGASLAPGERVLVQIALREPSEVRGVPFSAVVYDAQGAAWVYICAGDAAWQRARIDPVRRAGDAMLIAHGPDVGTCVAAVGAAELFGSEFEPGH